MDIEIAKQNAACVSDYLNFLKYKNVAPKTFTNYEVALRQLYEYCVLHNIKLSKLTSSDFLAFSSASYKDYKANTRSAKMSAISLFYEFLVITQKAYQNPILKIFYPKIERSKFEPFPDRLYKNLYNYVQDHSNPFYALGLDLMFYSGLRVSEVQNLDIVHDIKGQGDSMVLHIKGKGRKEREVPVFAKSSQDLIKSLRYDISSLVPYPLDVSQQVYQYHINQWHIKENIPGHFTCHSLRRAFALRAIKAYKDIEIVRYLMGHESYNTTLIYLYNNDRLVYDIDRALLAR